MYVKGDYGAELRIRASDVMKDVQASRSDPGQGLNTSKTVSKKDDPGQELIGNEQESPPEKVRVSCPKVLIVDDSPNVIRQITAILQEVGADVLTVEDGEMALDVMEREDPDLIVSEVDLSRLDGIKMAWHRTKIETIRDIPIIFLSYLKDYRSIVDGRGCPGVLAYFTKPLTGEELDRFTDIIRNL